MNAFQYNPKPSTLWLKIGVASASVLALGYAYVDHRLKEALINAPFVKASVQLLQNYPQADKYLGKPMFVKSPNLSHPFTEFNGDTVKFAMAVRGQNHSGELYSWCSKLPDLENDDNRWQVDRLDLSLDKKQRMTFYKRPGAPEQ